MDNWTCGVCQIITFGEWNCEVKPTDSEGEFNPVCKSCEETVRENFVADETF